MKIEIKMLGDIAVISLTGEFDSRGNQQLDKTLEDMVRLKNFKLILDLSSIRFIGQQTIGIVISHLKEFRANRGNIVFLNPLKMVQQQLKSNRLAEIFEIYSTRSEAIKSFEILAKRIPTSSIAHPSAVSAIPTANSDSDWKSRFETGEVLYANSCMLAALVKTLHAKGILTVEEVNELIEFDWIQTKGEPE